MSKIKNPEQYIYQKVKDEYGVPPRFWDRCYITQKEYAELEFTEAEEFKLMTNIDRDLMIKYLA